MQTLLCQHKKKSCTNIARENTLREFSLAIATLAALKACALGCGSLFAQKKEPLQHAAPFFIGRRIGMPPFQAHIPHMKKKQ